jgi:hypothetical protein
MRFVDPNGLEPMDWLWGGIYNATGGWNGSADPAFGAIYNATGGWSATQGQIDFFAGAGDVMLFGQGQRMRNMLGVDGGINLCSKAYSNGEWAGIAVGFAGGLAGGAKAAGGKAAGMEFSHWIPTRLGGPRTILNGNYVTIIEHALSDPSRYRFMSRAWKALNPMPSTWVQQWERLPMVLKGAVGGTAYGAAGAEINGCECSP